MKTAVSNITFHENGRDGFFHVHVKRGRRAWNKSFGCRRRGRQRAWELALAAANRLRQKAGPGRSERKLPARLAKARGPRPPVNAIGRNQIEDRGSIAFVYYLETRGGRGDRADGFHVDKIDLKYVRRHTWLPGLRGPEARTPQGRIQLARLIKRARDNEWVLRLNRDYHDCRRANLRITRQLHRRLNLARHYGSVHFADRGVSFGLAGESRGFLAKITHEGKTHSRFFSVKKHGGFENTRALATRWHLQKCQELGIYLRRRNDYNRTRRDPAGMYAGNADYEGARIEFN
jgi:hypothetical protein